MGGNYARGTSCSKRRLDNKGGACLDNCIESESLPAAFHLPEVSRQVYSETATLAYQSNIWVIRAMKPCGKYVYGFTNLLPAQRNAITSVAPTNDCLSFSLGYGYFPGSMRINFPNIKRIHLTALGVDTIRRDKWSDNRFWNDEDQKRTRKQWEELITARLKKEVGDDIEVIIEKGEESGPLRASESEDEQDEEDDEADGEEEDE